MAERIPDALWLHHAKRLPVGRTSRHSHPGDRTTRPNLIIGNDVGKFWCYCQSCKGGAVVEKSHVLVTGVKAPKESTQLDLPTDKMPLMQCDEYTRFVLGGLLASKNMDALQLPALYFSESRKRLLLDTGQGWLGRDTTERSDQKWLTYNRSMYLGAYSPGVAVVVEDPFSYYKIKWALRRTPGFCVYCALGTGVRPVLALQLLHHPRVVLFMDGDAAGFNGAERAARQLRGLGGSAVARCAPLGFDPKDLTAAQIRNHLCNV